MFDMCRRGYEEVTAFMDTGAAQALLALYFIVIFVSQAVLFINSFWIPAALYAVGFIALLAVMIGHIRCLGQGRDRLSMDLFRGMGRPLLHMLIGALVLMVLTGFGALFVLLPGFLVLVHLIWFGFPVVLEGRGFITAFKQSYGLIRGHRIRVSGFILFTTVALVALLTVPAMVLNSVVTGSAGIAVALLVGLLVQTVVAFIMVAGVTALYAGYDELLRHDRQSPRPR